MAPTPTTPATFAIGTRLFLGVLAVTHLVAFASFGMQYAGLLGPHGLLPAQPFLDTVHEHYGASAYARLPTLCWIFGAGKALPAICAVGVAAAIALLAGFVPALCLAVLWSCYLSLVSVGQVFFSFQWDALLLEATLLAVPLAPWVWRAGPVRHDPPRVARWLSWWLLARLMFLSAAVKLVSGDPTWRDLTALTFHFETQPLPTPLAWQVHQLPEPALRAMCVAMFVIEFVCPVCLFGPRRLRHRAALLLIALQVAIALTGNYTFFNLLAIGLCLPCLDDAWWGRVRRRPLPVKGEEDELRGPGQNGRRGGGYRAGRVALRAFALFVVGSTAVAGALSLGVRSMFFAPLIPVLQAIAPFQSLNNYGLFAVMTHPRTELILEGSHDDRVWVPYEFPHKPGELSRGLGFIAPFQPRLDWQLWFATLDRPERNPWVYALGEHLLRGTPAVLALLEKDPFPKNPPRYIRVLRYEYHFTDRAERKRTGRIWRRTLLDTYIGPSALNP